LNPLISNLSINAEVTTGFYWALVYATSERKNATNGWYLRGKFRFFAKKKRIKCHYLSLKS